jgi:glycosyltransferase involved in cell wall biosynthesis/fucose 4-O-acetylase-like acetyltransferase
MRDPLTRKALSEELFLVRGVSILLVVLIHVIGVEPLHGVRKLFSPDREPLRFTAELIHSFNMAVMLITSGAAVSLFGGPDTSFREFARRKVSKLAVPMLVWAPVSLGIQELSRARPHTFEDGLTLLGQVPTAWFPPYSIFWFVHALVSCTLLAWGYNRLAPPLGRWARPVYLVGAVALHLAAGAWGDPAWGVGMRYLRFVLFWNCFFGLGMCLSPWLAAAHRKLSQLPLALQALVPVALLGLMVLLYASGTAQAFEDPRQVNGPLGFCMQFALAVFLLSVARSLGTGWKRLAGGLVYLGSISMPIYLFHIYFVSGMRQALEKVLPGAPPALHLALGWPVGLLGPLGLYLLLGRNRAFLWSIGSSHAAPAARRVRVLFVAWFLRPERRWLGEFLPPERFECSYVGLDDLVDSTQRRTPRKKWWQLFRLAVKARWYLARHPQDLIVTAFPQGGFTQGLVNLLSFARTPHVVWYFNCGHEYHGLRKWLSRLAYRGVDRFIVYTKHERSAYARTFTLPPSRFQFTHLTGAELKAEEFRGARERFGLAPRYIAALGSSGRDYGTLFRAVEGLPVQLVVVAHPHGWPAGSVPSNVKVMTSIPQQDYLSVIAEAELVAIPVNNRETASGQMTLIQAMSLGVPVIATRCIGTEDYIRHGENGWFVQMGAVEEWRQTLLSVLEAPHARRRMATEALRFAQERFTDRAGAKLLEALAQELCAQR